MHANSFPVIAGTGYGDFRRGSMELISRNVHLTCKHINMQALLRVCVRLKYTLHLCIHTNNVSYFFRIIQIISPTESMNYLLIIKNKYLLEMLWFLFIF